MRVLSSERTAPPLWYWWSRAPTAGLSEGWRRPVCQRQVAEGLLFPHTDTHSPAGCPLSASPALVIQTWFFLSRSFDSRSASCCAANTEKHRKTQNISLSHYVFDCNQKHSMKAKGHLRKQRVVQDELHTLPDVLGV